MTTIGSDGASVGDFAMIPDRVMEELERRHQLCLTLINDMVDATVEELDQGVPDLALVHSLLEIHLQQPPAKLAEVLSYAIVELAQARRKARQ